MAPPASGPSFTQSPLHGAAAAYLAAQRDASLPAPGELRTLPGEQGRRVGEPQAQGQPPGGSAKAGPPATPLGQRSDMQKVTLGLLVFLAGEYPSPVCLFLWIPWMRGSRLCLSLVLFYLPGKVVNVRTASP